MSEPNVDDGRLEVHEIYESDLTQTTNLVVSACNSQKGALSIGDSILILTIGRLSSWRVRGVNPVSSKNGRSINATPTEISSTKDFLP